MYCINCNLLLSKWGGADSLRYFNKLMNLALLTQFQHLLLSLVLKHAIITRIQ